MHIARCYDSHVHWTGYGQMNQTLNLDHLKSAKNICFLVSKEKVFCTKILKSLSPKSFRGEWLMGFGWDDKLWPSGEEPHRSHLDHLSHKHPICFLRADGHAFWVNTKALEVCGLWSLLSESKGESKFAADVKKLEKGVGIDKKGELSGVFLDGAMKLIRDFIPVKTDEQVCEELLWASGAFLKKGFTHIRDVGCSVQQWEQSVILSEKNELRLFAEVFFHCSNVDQVEQTVREVRQAKSDHPYRLRPMGVKVFYDGALGSEGAYLSEPYKKKSEQGFLLMTDEQLEAVLRKSWEQSLEVAIHVIGDESAHRLMRAAHKIYEKGLRGRLHLEHGQILRPETIALMKNKDVFCHMQPCHWLDDKEWLFDKISQKLQSCLFRWRDLEQSGVSVFFGSDTPISSPSVEANYLAIQDAKNFLIPASQNFSSHHEHPDSTWGKNTYTICGAQGQVEEVYFLGDRVI